MPGLCGIYRMNMPIDCNFSTQHGITKTVEKDAALSNVYLRQYSIPKFQNDKMFMNADELFYSLEGTLLNAPELYSEYNADSKSALIRAMYLSEGRHFVKRQSRNCIFLRITLDRNGYTIIGMRKQKISFSRQI
jgi:hypothetical protein